MSRHASELIAICENDGEEKIKKDLLERKRFSQFERPVIEEWLRRKEEARATFSDASREDREIKTLSIAKEANRIASDALDIARKNERWAMYAAIIATVAIIIAAMTYIKTP